MPLTPVTAPTLDDPEEFDRVYRELRPRMVAAAQRIVRDPAIAEDVVQDVFTQLWRRPGSFDGRRGSLRSYLTLVARSRAIDVWRSEQARGAATDRLAERIERHGSHARAADEEAVRREAGARLVAALDTVPRPQRDALLLRYGRDLSAPELAATLDIPVGTAKSRIRLGLARLHDTAESLAA